MDINDVLYSTSDDDDDDDITVEYYVCEKGCHHSTLSPSWEYCFGDDDYNAAAATSTVTDTLTSTFTSCGTTTTTATTTTRASPKTSTNSHDNGIEQGMTSKNAICINIDIDISDSSILNSSYMNPIELCDSDDDILPKFVKKKRRQRKRKNEKIPPSAVLEIIEID